jgi:antitoxin (DNA-binding transcriptional repressor) of toxin-antitoxin stability system
MTRRTKSSPPAATPRTVSKSKFKAQALELFREVEQSGEALVITDRGRPVLQLTPYCPDPEIALEHLRDTVLEYQDPFAPVADDDWEAIE